MRDTEASTSLLNHTLLRLFYAALREQIWPPEQVELHVIDFKGVSHQVRNEFDLLGFIYVKDASPPSRFNVSIRGQESLIALRSLKVFFETLILPYLDPKGRNSYPVFLEKVEASLQAEELLLGPRIALRTSLAKEGGNNMWEWIQQHIHLLRDGLLLMQFASQRGNPTHPLAKLRKGFSAEEITQYSPEFGQSIQLPVLAVAIGLCKATRQ
ncbi:MAG: IucA/IucC family protein, partial [Bacteroidota bacterium]